LLIFSFWTTYASNIEERRFPWTFLEIISFILNWLSHSIFYLFTCWFLLVLLVPCAAQLPLFFPICCLFKSPLHLCVCYIGLVHQVSHGWRLSYSLEGTETFPCFSSTNDVLFYLSLVCWWAHRISYVSRQHKPGWSVDINSLSSFVSA
jgi:hypothetical protein